MMEQNYILCAVYYPGKSSFEVKIEADSNDITEHPHDDKLSLIHISEPTRPY